MQVNGDYLVIHNPTNEPVTGLLSVVEAFKGGRTITGKPMSGANVRRRRQAWRRAQPTIYGIDVARYTFWRSRNMEAQK